ncbi:helix-turn-helix domain-containing protein [Xylophilus rhododendri]|uniref:Helix-turn-helix domain-containing protein n=1 Tax=Xylophilus rhododendri TaxID=2697032 RepID=A0A857J7N4_9BURK|nr:helix-turn-helix transcriptional regulator [Xylophilus rhododendri]QHI99866.1 helix-turn-helix domain-containing protein [Xylophilus rhododendri]
MKSAQDSDLLQAFAAEIRARRTATGDSQEALAFKASLNRTFVAKLELAQTSPSLSTLFRLAAALQVAPAELVGSVSQRYRRQA